MKEEGNEQRVGERGEGGKLQYATHARPGWMEKKRARDQGRPRAGQGRACLSVGGEGPRKVVMCHPKTPGGCAADTVVRFAGVGMVQESTVRAIESMLKYSDGQSRAGDTTGRKRGR